MKIKRREISRISAKLKQPDLSSKVKQETKQQIKTAESALAQAIQVAVRHVAETGASVAAGSKGSRALSQLARAAKSLSDPAALATLKKSLALLSEQTTDPAFKKGLARFLKS